MRNKIQLKPDAGEFKTKYKYIEFKQGLDASLGLEITVYDTYKQQLVTQERQDNGEYPYMLVDLQGNITLHDKDGLEVDFYTKDVEKPEDAIKLQFAGLNKRFIITAVKVLEQR